MITRFALDHRRLVWLGWVLLTAVGALTVTSTTGALSHSVATSGTAGSDANAHMMQTFGLDGNEQPAIAVLRLPPGMTMQSAEGQAAATHTFEAAAAAGRVGVADYANTQNPRLISSDGGTTWALITMPNPDIPLGIGVLERLQPVLSAAAPPRASVTVTGFEPLQVAGGGASAPPSVLLETLIGGAGALLILLFVYGSAIAVLPLLMALPTVLTTFLLVLGLEQVVAVHSLVEYLVAFVGLGVAIDYSLLIVTRWREGRERGLDNEEAILAAGSTAGRAVVLSGLAVAVGLVSLLVLPVSFLRSIGYGGMLVPLVAIAASLTLLPVTLAAWGPALDSRRFVRGSTTFSLAWERWGHLVARRRWIAGAVGLAIMVGVALPGLTMRSGQASADALAATGGPAADAYHQLTRQGVPSAVVFPVQLETHGGSAGAAQAAQIAAQTPGVFTILAPDAPAFRNGSDALVSVIPVYEGNRPPGQALVATWRTRPSTRSSTSI